MEAKKKGRAKQDFGEKMKSVFKFILISIPILFIEILVLSKINETLPDITYFWGMPFETSNFIFGIYLITITVILFLFFPKVKGKVDKGKKLK